MGNIGIRVKLSGDKFELNVDNSAQPLPIEPGLPQPIDPTKVEGIEAIVDDVATTMQTLLDQIRMWQNKP